MTELELLELISDKLDQVVNGLVWVCRILSMLCGLLIMRLVTLRSPV